MKNYKQKNFRGFTLVELLVSASLISIIGTIVLSIFVTFLRSTTKINNLQLIRQNGNFAVTQMSKMIQFASGFNGVSLDGVTYSTACELPLSGNTTYNHVRITNPDNGITTFSCDPAGQTIASNSASLIDNVTFAVPSCHFTCTQLDDVSPKTISIIFTISKRNSVNIIDDPSPVNFKTSVTFRNNN